RGASAAGGIQEPRLRLLRTGTHFPAGASAAAEFAADGAPHPREPDHVLRTGGDPMSAATLLYKESRLVVPLPYLGIVALALLNLIPHYPPVIGVSYVLPALLIAFAEANANKDHQFTISLPVARDRLVLARHLSVVALEVVQ